MILAPNDVIERLKIFCEENNLGLSQISLNSCCVLIMGVAELSPDQASLIAAHALISGILDGTWNSANEETKSRISLDDKVNLN
jgi:hypothetical protein